ncbi:MAG TPA: hypothetical protein VH558_07915, partial [Pseudolabrys sp.]
MSAYSNTVGTARHVSYVVGLAAALFGLACGAPQSAAQNAPAHDMPAFAPGMIGHMQRMEQF